MQTLLHTPSEESLTLAQELLESDQLVAIPTETVYGLAGNAFSPQAVTRIFEAKERPTFDPLIVHIAQPQAKPKNWVQYLDQTKIIEAQTLPKPSLAQIETLIERFWPGPLTFVLPKHSKIPDLVTSGLSTVAVRMPQHPVAQSLLKRLSFPLAAPSANRFGRISPTDAQAVSKELHGRIPLILDGGPCSVGLESTILALSPSGDWRILRPGQVTELELKHILGKSFIGVFSGRTDESTLTLAPGMLASHYAPTKPLFRLEKPISSHSPDSSDHFKSPVAALVFQDPKKIQAARPHWKLYCPSPRQDASECAQSFFSILRKMDESDAQTLVCEPCPHTGGLWSAIQDRLNRASQPLKAEL
jgi:L-threonylcarbamoyladenylate synthase